MMLSKNNEESICILVYGNIASGKSAFSEALIQNLHDFRYICLDVVRDELYRSLPNENGLKRENKVHEQCMDQLMKPGAVVFETTAGNKFFQKIHPLLKIKQRIVYVYISCPPHLCYLRYVKRLETGKKIAPLPYWDMKDIKVLLSEYHNQHRILPVDIELDSSRYETDELVNQFISYLENV